MDSAPCWGKTEWVVSIDIPEIRWMVMGLWFKWQYLDIGRNWYGFLRLWSQIFEMKRTKYKYQLCMQSLLIHEMMDQNQSFLCHFFYSFEIWNIMLIIIKHQHVTLTLTCTCWPFPIGTIASSNTFYLY